MKTLAILVISTILLLSFSSLAADSADDSAEKRSIGEFVSPDGRIDLEAVKNSGYQGPLDLDGINILIDPQTGEPVVQVSASTASSTDSNDIYWDNSISPSMPGVYGFVYALAIYDSNLIAAGSFNAAGGVTANLIASWDGTSWSALGTGMGGGGLITPQVYTLNVYNNQLIAGGDLLTAGSVTANYIASWDGTSWSALGTGMDTSVFALTVYDSNLIAGGKFTTAGGVSASSIASWDGTSWSALGAGIGGTTLPYVYALTVYDSQLIAGGRFITAGGMAVGRIASWDGTSWSALGSGTNSRVSALTVFNSTLIAGGEFFTAGNKFSAFLGQWTKGLLSCCVGDRGDLNGDGVDANILDLTFAVDRIFRGGPASVCPEEADVNADGTPHTILDLTFLVDKIFRGGALPPTCGTAPSP